MNVRLVVVFVALALSFAIAESLAQDFVIVTDRPDQTESAAVVPKGNLLQLETGVMIEWEDWNTDRTWIAPTTLLRVPLLKDLEFRYVYNRYQIIEVGSEGQANGGFDNQVGFKWSIADGSKSNGTQLALLMHFETQKSGNGRNPTVMLCVSHDIGENWALGYNIGVQNDEDFKFAISLGRSLNEKLSIYIEPYGALDNEEYNVDWGIVWLQNNRLQWDWSMAVGLNHQFYYQAIGASYLLGK
ncbi:MAG: transporter [Bacteroidetes bacterium]|nr:transporter [Bacteroidota bacterium]MDA1335349.1 transporter [Bacteroidota bacterium]